MPSQCLRPLSPVALRDVSITGPFLEPRITTNRCTTLPVEYQQLKQTGRIDAFRLDWKPGQPNPPHIFWDSDVAKWVEAVGYSLATHPDAALEALADGMIDLIASAQQPDGYLNVHFTVVEPEKRWTNLRDWHELYCAGHLMEAAVAYYQGTGKRKLLDVLCRYADYVASVFGPGEGQKRGYPGHEEVELALVKLYRATGQKRYLDLAAFFVNERGRQPHYYDAEARARGDDPTQYWAGDYAYLQAHLPIREQTTAEGHAVRAGYLYTGVADVAAETGDATLLAACERLWRNVTERRMYLTGGVGSSAHGERFTYDYDLPNDLAYTETCAAIALVFWAHRMAQITADARYVDVLERALYNGVLSGISLDGKGFFYANPLEVDPESYAKRPDLYRKNVASIQRREWFGCACCPPNVARLLASLGSYAYAQGPDCVYVQLYIGGEARLEMAGKRLLVAQETRYPWEGTVRITVQSAVKVSFKLALRIPGWCRGATVMLNGEPAHAVGALDQGYLVLERAWVPGDCVELYLPMPIERMYAHPLVRADSGRVALQRGPLVYCLEEADNGPKLDTLALAHDAALEAAFAPDLLGGVVVIRGQAQRQAQGPWAARLYETAQAPCEAVPFMAIPYYAWANRKPGGMMVWVREC